MQMYTRSYCWSYFITRKTCCCWTLSFICLNACY